MLNTDNLLTPKVLEEITARIGLHHYLYSQKVSGTTWEEILHRSLLEGGLNSEWKSGSHTSGADILCKDLKISCKSGIITGKKKKTLSISSYRTTKYKTIEEKLTFLGKEHEDVIFSIVCKDNDYKLYIFAQPPVANLVWETSSSGWTASDDHGNVFKILKSASDQFWMYLSLDNWELWGHKVFDLGKINDS